VEVHTVVLYLRLKWPGHEVRYLPNGDEVKNECRSTYTLMRLGQEQCRLLLSLAIIMSCRASILYSSVGECFMPYIEKIHNLVLC